MRQPLKTQMVRKLLVLGHLTVAFAGIANETNSKLMMSVAGGQHQELNASLARMAVEYGPQQRSGLTTSAALEYFEAAVLPASPQLEPQSLANFRVGVGYRWQWLDFYLLPQIGVASNLNELPDYQLGMWKLQSFTALTAGYQFRPNWATFLSASYDSGHDAVPASTVFTLGLSYRFGASASSMPAKAQPQLNIPPPKSKEPSPIPETVANAGEQEENSTATQRQLKRKLVIDAPQSEPSSVITAAEPVSSVAETFDERVTFAALKADATKTLESSTASYYSVQVGSFKKRLSIKPFLDKWGLNPEDLIYREEGSFTKVSFGRYESKALATLVQEQLTHIGISCFVIKLPRTK